MESNKHHTTGTGSRYSRIVELGEGGMAEVTLAVARGPSGFNKLVVLKTMRRHLAVEPELREMFLQEARLSARLNHPNIVQVLEVINHPIAPSMVMEYLDGQPVSAIMRTMPESLTLAMRLWIMREMLAGLHFSHELQDFDGTPLKTVHRDVSPQNVFVTYDGVVKVLDFGIAKVASQPAETRSGVIKGKLCYMPQEQLLLDDIDRRVDVYAAGCMLWHFVTGERLWAHATDNEIMRGISEGRVPDILSVAPDIDEELGDIVMRAIAPLRENRFESAKAFSNVLAEYAKRHNLHCTTTELGAAVSKAFADTRDERGSEIRRALQDLPSTPPDSTASLAPEEVHSAPPQKRSWVPSLVLLGVGALVLAGIGVVWMRTPSANSTPSEEEVSIVIRIEGTPDSTRFAIDGKPIEGNPVELEFPRSPDARLVTASAEGYVTQKRVVHFDREVSISFALQSKQAPVSPPTEPSASATPSEKPDKPKKTGPIPRVLRRPPPPPTSPPDNTPPPTNCTPPYRIQNGVKVYKPECI